MGWIRIKEIVKEGSSITFIFGYDGSLSAFFSGEKFTITYSFNIENIPDSILIIPFICNILPMVWLTNSVVYVDDIDADFYECLPQLKKGYEVLYSDVLFKGRIEVKKVTKNKVIFQERSAMFFSGGLDSYQTLISHIEEKPLLISIWGSDIKVNNENGWNNIKNIIETLAKQRNLSTAFIRSSFREFDDESALDKEYHDTLGDGWWHGVKHGIGLLGHVAPIAYKYGIQKMYIASSHWPELGIQKCASSPYIDNYVRFCGCQVIHDGFEYSRQDKVHNIAEYKKAHNENVDIHVCWETQTGKNCCHCEKCYRMMAGLFAEGEDPKDYGFKYSLYDLVDMERVIKTQTSVNLIKRQWSLIKDRMIGNYSIIKKPDFKWYQWIIKADFEHPEKMTIAKQ